MKYLSLCSGIEAATVAWHSLGWQAVAFAEIEAYPSAVLAHHYPDVPNMGDFTAYRDWPESLFAEADIIVAGTPCQAFSVAGRRESLADERGNLTLTFANLVDHADRIRLSRGRAPVIIVWENVPGVLNTDDNAFGCYLGALVGSGAPLVPGAGQRWTNASVVTGPRRTASWRTLDAQFFGLAQRRRRVFVVASAGDLARVIPALLVEQGLRRHTPPSREAGEGTAPTIASRSRGGGGLGTDAECDGALIPELAGTLGVSFARRGYDDRGDTGGAPLFPELAHTLRAEGYDASEDGTGRGVPLIPIIMATGQASAEIGIGIGTTLNCNHEAPIVAFAGIRRGDAKNETLLCVHGTQDPCVDEHLAFTLGCNNGMENALAFNLRGREGGAMPEVDPDGLACQRAASGGSNRSYIAHHWQVRRLTPRECERLQGFPDDYTRLPDWTGWRALGDDESAAEMEALGFKIRTTTSGQRRVNDPDGPRYKALGNSMATPVMHWIGHRIEHVLSLLSQSQPTTTH